MAALDRLPAKAYIPPPPAQVPRRRRSLNTIIEDEEDSPKAVEQYSANWFSPMTDHFPTPRGNHFMPAPVMPPSPSSVSPSEYSQGSSAPWSRDSLGTQTTELADIYDVSSDEEAPHKRNNTRLGVSRTSSKSSRRLSTMSNRLSSGSDTSRASLPQLVIPNWTGQNTTTVKFNSPIPPTPPPKIPMSPAVLNYLTSQELLSSSATPSLDGSLSSEQLAAMSAPSTPATGGEDGNNGNNWGGIELQPDAMATLQALSGEDAFDQQVETVLEISQASPMTEMLQSPPPITSSIRRHNSVVLAPDQQMSLNCLSKLDIPSPGGFFSALSAQSRNTWHIYSPEPQSGGPPSSTTAECFYKTPWAPHPIERIVEVSETMSDGCPTARPTLMQQNSDETITSLHSHAPGIAEEHIVATEILADYDENYARELKDAASEHMDRTTMWLSAQVTFLSALINPPEERDDETALEKRNAAIIEKATAVKGSHESVLPLKKVVRFSAMDIVNIINCPTPKQAPRESAYYRSFQKFVNRSRFRDIYVHRLPRFEAIQIERATFPEAHRNHLLGKYQLSVVPMSEKKKRESANVARGDETIEDDLEKLKNDKEHEAMEQMWGATWNVMAMKMLNGGRLIAAPMAKRLARLSLMVPTISGVPRNRGRILDLGGQATCDWGWHVAMEYQDAKIYTVTTKASRQLSNSNIRGPKNHRQVAVEKLTRLPFKEDHFDLISARNFYSMLKIASENGEDEYDSCLAECMRCLKPGGFLEFSLMDSDLVNGGPRGQAKSVEFGFNLKTRGYDPSPTKAWVGRLNKAGFVGIKRAWMYLPMGAPLPRTPVKRDSMGVEIPLELEAMVTGSTNAAANITGLIGSWAWEKWMLKLELESGRSGESIVSVYDIVEEGRKLGTGWRSLSGWARKPLRK